MYTYMICEISIVLVFYLCLLSIYLQINSSSISINKNILENCINELKKLMYLLQFIDQLHGIKQLSILKECHKK